MWWCRCVCEYDCVSLCIYNCEGIECVFYSLQLHSELSTSLRFLLKMTSLKNKLPNLVDWRELREKPFFSIKKLKSIVKSMCNYVGWFVELHKIFASFSVFLLAFFIQRFAHHKSFFHCQNGVYHILFSAMDHCFWFFFVTYWNYLLLTPDFQCKHYTIMFCVDCNGFSLVHIDSFEKGANRFDW